MHKHLRFEKHDNIFRQYLLQLGILGVEIFGEAARQLLTFVRRSGKRLLIAREKMETGNLVLLLIFNILPFAPLRFLFSWLFADR